MFHIPVTVPYLTSEGVFPVDVSIPIDDLVLVTPLDNDHSSGVESDTLYSCLPSSELLFDDGRRLPVMETAATINRYLDMYRFVEGFYTAPATPAQEPYVMQGTKASGRGVVIPLFGRSPCATSEASTPD